MKNFATLITIALFLGIGASIAQAQVTADDLQYFRSQDQNGLNVFETPKTTDVDFDGIRVKIGGSNTLQFQALSQSNTNGNSVSGEHAGGTDIDISRINIGGGWFMTKNVLTKVEYVTQSYDGFTFGPRQGAEFSGIMMEAVISL